jgi:hypothetical protein
MNMMQGARPMNEATHDAFCSILSEQNQFNLNDDGSSLLKIEN